LKVEGLPARDFDGYLVDLIVHYDDDALAAGAGMETFSWTSAYFDSTLPLSSFPQLREDFDRRLLAAMTGLDRPPEEGPVSFPARGFPANFLGSVGDMEEWGRTPASLLDSWLDLEELHQLLNQSRLAVGQLNLPTRLLLAVLDFLGQECGRSRVRIIFRVFQASQARQPSRQEG
jgi:hypothetical protein